MIKKKSRITFTKTKNQLKKLFFLVVSLLAVSFLDESSFSVVSFFHNTGINFT